MLKNCIVMASIVAGLCGCSSIASSMGQLTVKDYTAESGQRVMAGQAGPKAGYGCTKIAQEKQDLGISGDMNRAAAIEKITKAAVDTAPSKGANYAYVIIPSETSVMGFNVNAFKDEQVAYYKCTNLPST